MVTRSRDGSTWRIGTDAEVAWIVAGTDYHSGLPTSRTRTITGAIPAAFEAYAIVLVAYGVERDVHDRALLTLLREQSPGQRWWLGYLDTGADDIVFPDAPKVTLYARWHYVLIEAGPDQAAAWRPDGGRAFGTGDLPNLMFPLTAPGWCLRCGTTTGAASAARPCWWTSSCAILICRPGRWHSARTPHRQVIRPSEPSPSYP